jgi:hypothetical protein
MRGIAKDGVAAADHRRHAWNIDVKSIEAMLRALVRIEIDVVKRMAVSCQECPRLQNPRTVCGADHHDVTHVARDHPKVVLAGSV